MISSSKSVEVENIILSYTEVYLESIPMKDILKSVEFQFNKCLSKLQKIFL